MGILINIAQTFLDGLKWLMEGNNWLFLLPVLFISLFTMFYMVRIKETFLIFIWYLATVAIGSLIIVLLWGDQQAFLFAAAFLLLYLLPISRIYSKDFMSSKRQTCGFSEPLKGCLRKTDKI
ncbi:hypothetical protein SNF32_08895 [Enterococcus mundtii]|nr:hypothetical protein [Enterococcus mundtii]